MGSKKIVMSFDDADLGSTDLHFDNDELDKDTDDLITVLARIAEIQNKAPHVEVKEKIEIVKLCYEIMKNITDEKQTKVSYKINKPYDGFGSVTAYGKEVVIKNPKLFAEIAAISDNFDVWSQLDGTTYIDFGFYGLAKGVDEND